MQLGAMTIDEFLALHYDVCTAAPRKKRAYAIPRTLSSIACGLGFVTINFFAKPVDALASRVQSLRTPRAEKDESSKMSDKMSE